MATENSIAYLQGKNLRQRAEALIQIAHPKFRDELARAPAAGHGWGLGAATPTAEVPAPVSRRTSRT